MANFNEFMPNNVKCGDFNKLNKTTVYVKSLAHICENNFLNRDFE